VGLHFLVTQFLPNQFLRFKTILSPQMAGVTQFKLPVMNPKINKPICPARKHKVMEAGKGELRGKKTAHITAPHSICEGRFGA